MPSPSTRWVKEQELEAFEELQAERRAKEERKALEHLTQAELGHLTLLRVVADQKQEIDNLRLALKQEREKSGSASRPNGEGNDLIQSLEDSKPSVDPPEKDSAQPFDTASTGTEKESVPPFNPAEKEGTTAQVQSNRTAEPPFGACEKQRKLARSNRCLRTGLQKATNR